MRMTDMNSRRDSRTLDPETIHALSNHLGVILGFVDLVLVDTPADDRRRADLLEIKEAAAAAVALLTPGARAT
jgi:hypothetical protein